MKFKNLSSAREEQYEKYLFEEDLGLIRKMLIMGIILYSAFGIVDRAIDVSNLRVFNLLRFYIVTPLAAITFALSYHKTFYKLHQYLLTIIFSISGVAIVVMLTVAPEVYSYYGGLFLVFGYGFFLLRIKWQFVTIGSIFIVIIYYILASMYLQDHLYTFLIFSIFYISFILIAVFGSYTFATYRRDRYLQQSTLKGDNIILEKQNYENLIDIENSNYITIYSLAKLAESRDSFTGDHIDRVGRFALKLAKQIDIDIYTKNGLRKSEFLQSIELASTLHDIGKIAIPEAILLKPTTYTKEERAIMQEHCMLGSTTLREIQNQYSKNNFINMGIEICESHHENWDGTGYPRKLKGQDIPFSARLVTVIDVYDALISERPYKKAWSKEDSIAEILSLSGTKFDKDIVDAFIKCTTKE